MGWWLSWNDPRYSNAKDLDMRRAILTLGIVAGSLCFAAAVMAQRACVLDSDGEVVCGQLVQPGYAPQREYRAPRPSYEERRDDEWRYRDGNRQGPPPGPQRCQPGYTVQGGECKPYRGPQTCQKGFTVQDGVCKPYTGR
jgi:hypothetical protein